VPLVDVLVTPDEVVAVFAAIRPGPRPAPGATTSEQARRPARPNMGRPAQASLEIRNRTTLPPDRGASDEVGQGAFRGGSIPLTSWGTSTYSRLPPTHGFGGHGHLDHANGRIDRPPPAGGRTPALRTTSCRTSCIHSRPDGPGASPGDPVAGEVRDDGRDRLQHRRLYGRNRCPGATGLGLRVHPEIGLDGGVR
jgi:hypothetical protein